MAKNKFNKSWMKRHLSDEFVKQAQTDGYRARAAYKLLEIDSELSLIGPGMNIVDLGCAPGSWSQVATRRLKDAGKGGSVIGIDLLDTEPVDGMTFVKGDFTDEKILEELESHVKSGEVDLVMSDMAPNLSGIRDADAARVEYLIELAVDFASRHLKPSGSLLVKCFNGPAFNNCLTLFRDTFKDVYIKKPKASRDESSEVFLCGKTLKHGG